MYVNECFIGKQFSYNENAKFQYILNTLIGKTEYLGKVAQSVGGASQYSCPCLPRPAHQLFSFKFFGFSETEEIQYRNPCLSH